MKYLYIIVCSFFLFSCTDSKDIKGDIVEMTPLEQFPNDAMSIRQEMALEKMYNKPYPSDGMWYNEDFSTAMYALNRDTANANRLIIDLCNGLYPKLDKSLQVGSYHWQAYILEREYFLYSSKSKFFPGRMSLKAEQSIEENLWDWTSYNCTADLTIPERSTWIWGSENHQLQGWVSFWGAMQILKDLPDYQNRKYSDGSTPITLSKKFDEYFKAYFLNRAKHGLMVEVSSPIYSKYSLNTLYNLADFAEDNKLKELASNFLNVYWAEWAIEQINGVRGGSRNRCYPGDYSINWSGSDYFSWYHFGIGKRAFANDPGNISVYTTLWRPDKIVSDLVEQHLNNGNYAYTSRLFGLASSEEPTYYFGESTPVYKFNYDGEGMLRYTWVTPAFVMGMIMENALDRRKWNAVSSQNRWNGIIYSGNFTKRIFTQPKNPDKGSVYNAEWGVQDKGVMILQRMVGNTNEGLSRSNAQGQAIWIEKTLPLNEENGWYFSESPEAYTAIKIIRGGATFAAAADYGNGNGISGQGRWLVLNDESSPILFEVAEKKDFPSFDDFKNDIYNNKLIIEDTSVYYQSKYYNNSVKLFSDYSSLPLVNDKLINVTPDKLMDSPFLNSVYESGLITVSNGNDSKVYDFKY